MGFLETRWEATHEGHNVVVSRNELGRGFKLEWDGVEVARRAWSLIGLGELHGSVELDGRHLELKVSLEFGGLTDIDGICRITVDGKDLPVRHIR